MSVNDVKQALGSWDIRLRPSTPKSVLDQLAYFGHVAIVPGIVTPQGLSDTLLAKARYVGVLRERVAATGAFSIGGPGMPFWLGDEDEKGDVFETAVTLTAATFAASVAALLPPGGSVTAGTINAIAGTYTGTHQWQTPRAALDYVTQLFAGEWRVNGDGTLDAGTVAQLYRTTPHAILVRKQDGREMDLVSMPGEMSLDSDVADYTTRVVLLAEGEGTAISTGAANAVSVPYKDIHGNTAKLTRLVSESETTDLNADARAQIQLNRFLAARANVQLSTNYYDVRGDLAVGDYLAVYDPDSGFVDSANELYWRGQPINPIFLRCIELNYPVPSGWTVAYRDPTGVWIDLSNYYIPESGQTTITVGEFSRNLEGIVGEPIGIRVNAPASGSDTTTPGTVVFGAYSTAAYQSSAANDLKAAVQLTWTQPLNTDLSTIIDGDHYEIQYRVTSTFSYGITWDQANLFRWNDLAGNTWDRPLSNPAATGGNWTSFFVPFDQTVALLQELTVAGNYEFRIRAVDSASPPHPGAWSASLFVVTTGDVLAPSTPAAPVVASSRLAIQIVHTLGKASGGTYNLEPDLDYLEIHAGSAFFFPDASTLIGKLAANASMLMARIAAVGTFAYEDVNPFFVRVVAVDKTGNRSAPSPVAAATILLVDDSHITSLTVSKVTAGTISADWLLGASIKTALSGRRIELNSFGLQAYDALGALTTNLSADPTIDGQYMSFLDPTDARKTLAGIDNTGKVSGQDVYASDNLVVRGQNVIDDIITPRPGKVLAWMLGTAIVVGGGVGVSFEKGYYELSFVADPTRLYLVSFNTPVRSTVSADRVVFRLRDGGASQPTIAGSPALNQWAIPTAGAANGGTDAAIFYINTFTAGLHRLLLTFYALLGTGQVAASSLDQFNWFIQDFGEAIPQGGVLNDGSGTLVAPLGSYTTTYGATWTQTYQGNNSIGINPYDDDMYQGDDGGGYGNGRCLIGFDFAKIMDDLAGATILSCSVTIYFFRWAGSTGTAVIGTHSYTSRPNPYNPAQVTDNRVQSTKWPKPGKRLVPLGTTIGDEFRTGVSKGIALGPGPSSESVYSGTAEGHIASGNRPILTIVYTK